MKLKQIDTIKRVIDVHIPVDGAGFDKQKMTAKYRIIEQDEINSLIEGEDDDATLDRIFTGFEHVRDDSGTTIEDTEENRTMLRNIPYVRQAIIRGFFDMVSGGRRKN